MLLKWGIASAGKISNDFVTALKNLPSDEHKVVSVAARDKDRADAFAVKFNIENSYDSYDALANDCNIDIVYVAMLNPQHFSTCKLMLENGKHVLCEKPLCIDYRETELLVKIAKEKGVFLMEGMWSRHLPLYGELRAALEKKVIGEVYQVTVNFGMVIDAPRVSQKNMGGGTALDIGVYTSQLAMLVFGADSPHSMTAVGHLNGDGVDESYSCIVKYPKGKTATLLHHSCVKFDNTAYVYGTGGCIKIHEPFWCSTKLTINNDTLEFPLPENNDGAYNYVNSAGLCYEAAEAYRCINKGLTESLVMSLNDSLALAKFNDEIRKQLGVQFANDR